MPAGVLLKLGKNLTFSALLLSSGSSSSPANRARPDVEPKGWKGPAVLLLVAAVEEETGPPSACVDGVEVNPLEGWAWGREGVENEVEEVGHQSCDMVG